MIRIVLLVALVTIAYAGVVKVHDCGNGEVTEVRVDQCTSDPCVIKRGKPLHFEADFTANEDASKVTIEIAAKVKGLTVHLPGIETDGCAKGRLPCPLKKGSKYTFKYDLTIDSSLPAVKGAELTAKLVGDGGKVLACSRTVGDVE